MMFATSISNSIMSMKCDIYIQKNTQSSSGAITREWIYHSTIPCFIQSMRSGGPFKGDDKMFNVVDSKNANPYHEILEIKMKSLIPLSKRWRVTSIRTSANEQVYVELDRYGNPDMIFEVKSSHAEMDPLGKTSHYHSNLSRVQVQYNDNTSS
jgi:hypothetical protein